MFDRENLPFWLACIALVLSFLVMIEIHARPDCSDAASWVQAIGSIGAIYAAYHMGSMQADRADRRELQRDLEAASGAYHVLQFARNAARDAALRFQPMRGWILNRDETLTELRAARQAIENYDLATIPVARIVNAMIRVAHNLQRIESFDDRSVYASATKEEVRFIYELIETERRAAFLVIESMTKN